MKRVLVTENVEASKLLIEKAFESLADSYDISFVSTADACLEYLQESHNYDLCFILFDLNVPGVVANGLLARLSMDEAFRTIPVIVFSEKTDASDIFKCYNDGANAFVRRPDTAEGYAKVIASIADFWGNINVLAKPEAVVEF